MTAGYPVPAGRRQIELGVRRSRFIATLDRAPTVAAARGLLAEMRGTYPDATHHVHAFAIGHGASVTHGASDDGEPSGTAGAPTLAVLKGSCLGDACIVTTRYFGGTKLGTGGLVRAYSDAARMVLAEAPVTRRQDWVRGIVDAPYPLYEAVARLVGNHGGRVEGEDFGPTVTLTFLI
ncbi:MAG: IMPACT family protein, partial [Anaerolineae bacterium]